jgi:gliding motility-associated-like protein
MYNPNATTLNAVYTPSSAELTAGTVTLTLTTDDPAGPCNSVSDQVVITIDQLAVVNAGGDQVICSSNSLSLNGTIGGATTSAIWSTSGSGTFTPSNTALNATYNPSAADITTAFVQIALTSDDPVGPCPSVTSSFNLSINLTPSANAGADFVSCSNVPVQLNGIIGGGASSLTWTGNGSFNNAAIGNAQYTPTNTELASGSATLTLTTDDPAGPCNALSDQVIVTFTIPATANAGSDQTICQGTNAILTGSYGGAATSATWTTSGSGTFSPNANTLTATYIPSNADIISGTVTLTLTTNDPAGPCGPVSDQMILTINPAPTANNLPITAICSGQTLNVQLPNTPTFSYTWIAIDNSNTSGESLALQSTSLINDVIVNNSAIDQQIVYQITPTNTVTGCLGQMINYSITVRPVATATQQANQTICIPNSTSTVIFTGNPAGTTFSWTNNQPSIGLASFGSGNIASFAPTNGGSTILTATITVTPSYQGCPGIPMTFDFNIIPTLTVNQIPDLTLCGGEIYPGAIFTGNAPGVTYIWQNNNTSISNPIVLPGLGSGDIAPFTTFNNGSLVQDATIIVTPTLSGCPNGTPMTFHIVVKPVPNVFVNPSSQDVCHNNASQYVDFSGNLDGFATYQWSHDNISIGLGTPGFNDIAPFTATNTGNIPQTSNFSVYATYDGCTGPNTTFTITVNPVPIIVATADQQLCGNTLTNSITFTSVNNVAGSVYNWTNSSPTIGLPATGAGNIGGFVVPDSLQTTLVSQFEVTPSFNGCNGATDIFNITVLPVPLVYPLLSQGNCSGLSTNPVLITGSHDQSAIYTWNNDNQVIGISGPNTTGIVPAFTLVGVPNTTTVSTFTVTPELTTNGQTCTGIPQTFTITAVDPIPDIYPIPDTVLCSGETFYQHIFAGTISNPNVNYNWQNNETASGLSSNGINSIPTQVLTNNTLADIVSQIIVTPTDGFCSGTSETFNVTVKPRPDLFLSQTYDSLCAGNSTDLILFSSSLPGTTYSWTGTTNVGFSPNNGTGGSIASVIGVNSGNTPLTDSIFVSSFNNGCSGDIDTLTITVNPSTIVSTSFPSYFFCSGTSINIPFNGSVIGANYTWTNDNTSTGIASSGTSSSLSTTVINNSYVDQTSTITVTPIFNGCPGQAYSFTVTVGPIPNVYSLSDITLCANTNTPLIDFQGDYASADFNWINTNISIADGGVLPQTGTGDINPFLTYNTSGITQIDSVFVTPVLNSCEGSVDTLLITVYPVTQVLTSDISVCSGTVIPPTCFSGSLAGVSYNWTSDNVGIGMDGSGVDCIPSFTSNTATTVQTATVTVTPVYNGCPGLVGTMQIEVRPVPIINPNSNLAYCDNEFADSVYFTSNITSNYSWTNNNISIGLGANGDGNLDSYLASNDFLAQQIDLNAEITVTPVAFGCTGSSSTFTITVHPLPIVNAGIDTFLCFNQCLTLDATGTALTYIWDNGGLEGQQYCPTTSIMMHVTGTDVHLCQNSDSIYIEYSTDLPPIVSAGPDSAICFGESYTLTAIGNADLYEWNNQVIDGEPFTPNETNTYVVIATDILNGCISSDTMELVVHPLPIVTANTLDSVLCDGEQAILWGEGATTYVWNNGITDSVWFTPTVSDIYTVIGYDQYGCTDTVDISMVVNPLPQVLFSTDMTYGGCLPFSPTFTDLTGANGNGPTSDSVTWYFGNNTSSHQLGSVTNMFDEYGCYDVTLVSTTAEGCTDSLTQQNYVCVNEIIASFEPDVTEQLISNPTFEFQNTSVNATSYQWFFGDGTESDFVNTIHTYDSIGYYQVVLVAYAQDGCTDTAVVVVKVNDQLIIYVPNAFTPDGDRLNDVFLPILTAGYKPGTYEFAIYNRWGERIFYTEDENEGWDGTYLGNDVQIGTYTYSIKFKDSMSNKVYTFNGRVSLIR